MSYALFLKEHGEGCDYTVGCGQTVIFMGETKPTNEDVTEALEQHGTDPTRFETVTVLKIVKDYTASEIQDLYPDDEDDDEDVEKETRRLEYEKLKAEFGG